MSIVESLNIYVPFILTLFVLSFFVYKDNVFFRFAQTSVIAIQLANVTLIGLKGIYDGAITPLSSNPIYIIPILLGIPLVIGPLWRKYRWIQFPSLAIVIGIGTGLGIRRSSELDIRSPIKLTASLPIIGGDYTPFDNIIILIATISILVFFIFTLLPKTKGALSYLSDTGRKFIMIQLGSMFATTALTRFTWLGARIHFILEVLGIL